MNEKQETIADIVAEMRSLVKPGETLNHTYEMLNGLADRIEAAHKRERDSIHRAMVLIAGIEMEGSEDPPRLWTSLEDAYDALSDALGTDGDATADMAEAESTGRHFVVRSSRNGAKMREALEMVRNAHYTGEEDGELYEAFEVEADDGTGRPLICIVENALAAPPRNCDVGTSDEQSERFENFCLKHIGCAEETGGRHCVGCPLEKASRNITQKCELYWAQMPYESEMME